ncbi:MAG: TIGR00645 family protein [Gammaproteobacteria bacterium]|nr:TIGR00645 family protein [Gammaproteobacteria bacterium]
MTNLNSKLERLAEQTLFASRWLMAPFYLGMVLALVLLLIVFGRELAAEFAHVQTVNAESAVLLALSLIDLSLTGNLLLIVMFSGYENFVSRMQIGDHEDRPSWMGTVDFSGMKMKLIASIVAISGIALLRTFLPLSDPDSKMDSQRIGWMVAIHLTFVISGVLLAVMDWITSKAEARGPTGH